MSYNILLVDDSSITRNVIKKTFGLTAVPVGKLLEAANGREALDLLEREWIDLVFLDINMPVMDGIEFMKELRLRREWKDLPVVICSTEGSRVRRAELADSDIRAYLRKPVTPEQLAETVQSLLGEGNGI